MNEGQVTGNKEELDGEISPTTVTSLLFTYAYNRRFLKGLMISTHRSSQVHLRPFLLQACSHGNIEVNKVTAIEAIQVKMLKKE